MNEKDCPCAKEGCSLSLGNDDHLNAPKKKHEIALNLGLISKNETCSGDQTPTPTRFIRNCEEVGLFQDLQYVNPFEETFKKAVELTKNGQSHVPQASSDDTLHTPHILPHIIQEKVLNTSQNLSDSEDTDFNINTLHMKPPEEEEAISFHTEVPNVNIIKDLLKLPSKVKPTAKVKEKDTSSKKPKPEIKAKKLKPQLNIYDKNIPNIVKRREMNRVAQMRCRMKRKELHFDTEHKMTTLKKQNEMLMLENSQLKAEVRRLNLILSGNKNPEEIKRNPPKRPIMPKINAFGTLRPIVLQAAPIQILNVANLSTDLNVTNVNTEVTTLIRPEDIKVEIDS